MKLFNLKNSILLVVFLLPVYLLRGSFFNALDILMLSVVIGWSLQETSFKKSLWSIWFQYKKTILVFTLIVLFVLMDIFKENTIQSGLGILKSWFILPFLFSLVAMKVFKAKERKKLFKAYLWSALVVSSISLIFWMMGATTYDLRLAGIFNSPNYLAMYIAPAFLLGLVFLRKDYMQISFQKKAVTLLGLALILITLYLTQSYASWLAMGLVVLVLTIIFYKNKTRIILASLVLAGFGFLLVVNTSLSKKDISSERSSLASRIMIWKASGKIIEDNWLLGIGPNNFQNKYLEYQKYFPPYLEWAVPHPHNLYLSFWLSGGIFSLAGFVYIVFLGLRSFARSKKKSSLAGALVILLYILLHGILDTTYFKNDLAVIFWLSYLSLL